MPVRFAGRPPPNCRSASQRRAVSSVCSGFAKAALTTTTPANAPGCSSASRAAPCAPRPTPINHGRLPCSDGTAALAAAIVRQAGCPVARSRPWLSRKRRNDTAGKARMSAPGADQMAPPIGSTKWRISPGPKPPAVRNWPRLRPSALPVASASRPTLKKRSTSASIRQCETLARLAGRANRPRSPTLENSTRQRRQRTLNDMSLSRLAMPSWSRRRMKLG